MAIILLQTLWINHLKFSPGFQKELKKKPADFVFIFFPFQTEVHVMFPAVHLSLFSHYLCLFFSLVLCTVMAPALSSHYTGGQNSAWTLKRQKKRKKWGEAFVCTSIAKGLRVVRTGAGPKRQPASDWLITGGTFPLDEADGRDIIFFNQCGPAN